MVWTRLWCKPTMSPPRPLSRCSRPSTGGWWGWPSCSAAGGSWPRRWPRTPSSRPTGAGRWCRAMTIRRRPVHLDQAPVALDRLVLRRHCPRGHRPGSVPRLRRRPPHLRAPASRSPVPDADQLKSRTNVGPGTHHGARPGRTVRPPDWTRRRTRWSSPVRPRRACRGTRRPDLVGVTTAYLGWTSRR